MLKKIILVSRPIFWPIAPAAYLFGVYSSGTAFGWLEALQAMLLWIPLGAYVFGINDLYDIKSDEANPRRSGHLWGSKVTEKDRGWIISASILVVALIMLSTLVTLNPVHILVTALFLPFPFLYSAPPIRLKSRPILDSLTNATYTYGPFAMGYSLSGTLGFLNPGMILFALVFSAAHAIGTIMDLEGDRKAGIRTFASVLGSRPAAAFAVFILALNLPFSYMMMESMFALIVIYTLASLFVLVKPTPKMAKNCFIVMVASLLLWIAYAGGAALGFWPLA